MLTLIVANRLPVNQSFWSPYSTMSWALVTHCHKKPSLARPSIIIPHAGLTRTLLEMEKTARVEGTRQLIEQVRDQCIICRKQLEKVCQEHPGKIHEPMLLPPSAHHDYTMVDILQTSKFRPFPIKSRLETQPN